MRAWSIASAALMLAVLIFGSMQFQVAQADLSALENRALSYVKNVLPFDMSHYLVMVQGSYSLPSAPNDPTITQAVSIDLKSSDSVIHVVCVYINGSLHQCGVTPLTGRAVGDSNYTTLRDKVAHILEAHQEQTGLDSTDLLNTLSLVNDGQQATVSIGNVNLTVSHGPDIVGLETVGGLPVPIQSNSSFSDSFFWSCLINGTTVPFLIDFNSNGIFHNLQDERPFISAANSIDDYADQATSSTPNSAQPTSNPTLAPGSNPTVNPTPQLETPTTSPADPASSPAPMPIVPEFPAVLAITFLLVTILAVVVVFRRKTQ